MLGVALGFYAFVVIGVVEGGLGVLIPSIRRTYDLGPAAVTLLFVSQMAGYVVSALASSLLASRVGLARTLLVAAASLAAALLGYALTTHWPIMVGAGTLVGLGIGLTDAGVNSFLASDPRRARLLGAIHGFYGIGALLGPAIATTLLAAGVHWRQVYLVFAAVVGGMVGSSLWASLTGCAPLARRAAGPGEARGSLRAALKTPAVLVAGLLLLVYVGAEASIGNWAYSVQTESRGTPPMLAGYGVSAYWLGLTAGRLGMGALVGRVGVVRTVDMSLALLLVGLVVWWRLPDQLWSLPLIGLALAAVFPGTVQLLPQRVPAAVVPAAVGLLTSVASLGATAIPAVVGWIAGAAGLSVIPALMLPLAAAIIVLHRSLAVRRPGRPG